MKKIVLMILVAMVPFLTMAQKKANKKKNKKTEINEGLNASYEFMVITGYELANDQEDNSRANSPAGLKNNVMLNWQKAYKQLGWKPKVDLISGIKKTIEWYKINYK